MLFNVIGYDNQIIGQVEASDAIEAWSEAGKRFENILDVREVMVKKYGPPDTAAPEVKEIWYNILKETEAKYPIGHPLLVAEAKRASKSQEEMQLMIAQETYLDRRRTLLETWAGEYDEVEEFEEEEE